MSKVLTDDKLINEFLDRGVEAIFPSREALEKKLKSGERLKIYQGFDPTGPYLHVGHAIGIRALRILQKLGHEVIFLVGDFTSKIGDPDKGTTRKILTDEEIEKNMSGWKEQASQLIDFGGENPVRFERNHQWLSKLSLEDILRLMSNFTVQQILQRDLFKKRMEEDIPLKMHEIMYPLMQGYDGVAMEVDMEIGGADQIFNMLVGRDLSKIYIGKEKFVRANKMMDAPDGITMSKTKGNGINLGDTHEEMFGKAMSYPDSAILSGLELLTDVPIEEIKKIKTELENGANPMKFKKLMAYEIVKLIKGEEKAKDAQDYFVKTIQKKEMPDVVEEEQANDGEKIVDFMVRAKLAESKADARRKIEQGGVSINGENISDFQKILEKEADGKIMKVGKKDFRKIKF
jgi:tyrosyl-tRNA synthetase